MSHRKIPDKMPSRGKISSCIYAIPLSRIAAKARARKFTSFVRPSVHSFSLWGERIIEAISFIRSTMHRTPGDGVGRDSRYGHHCELQLRQRKRRAASRTVSELLIRLCSASHISDAIQIRKFHHISSAAEREKRSGATLTARQIDGAAIFKST